VYVIAGCGDEVNVYEVEPRKFDVHHSPACRRPGMLP